MTGSQIYSPAVESRSRHLEIRGIDYHVLEWGDPGKPLLVMLHGWGDCAASFQFTVDEIGDDFFVVAPDWRGFGHTHLRARSYWFPDYVADLDALLSNYAPESPVDLLGHSMGANVAALYAGVFPERVRSFVNVEGFGLPDSDPEGAPAHYRRWIERSRETAGYTTYDSFDELAARIRKRSPSMPGEMAGFVARQWAIRTGDGRIELRADPAHKLPNAVQYRRAEAAACWRAIRARILLVMGRDSQFTGEMRDWTDPDPERRPFPGARTVVVEGAGHMLHFEKPAELAAVARDFLRSA